MIGDSGLNAFAAGVLKLFDDALSVVQCTIFAYEFGRINRPSRNRMMTDTERNTLDTDPGRTMTRIAEADGSRFLTRFALLSIETIGDATTVARPIADASDGLPDAGMQASTRER